MGRPQGKLDPEASAQMIAARQTSEKIAKYLDAVWAANEGPSKPVDIDKLHHRLKRVEELIAGPSTPIVRLERIQERANLRAEIEAVERGTVSDFDALEEFFIERALEWSAGRKPQITYGAFREVGVSASVLRRAGFKRVAIATTADYTVTGSSNSNGHTALDEELATPAPARTKPGRQVSAEVGEVREIIVNYLRTNGDVVDDTGFATKKLQEAAGVGAHVRNALKQLEDDGMIRRDINGKRTYRIALGAR